MVVVPEPAVKCCCAFGAVAVDGAVGPAGEHGADEALGFAVGLRSVGPRAQVAQTWWWRRVPVMRLPAPPFNSTPTSAPGDLEREPQTVRLDQDRRPDPRLDHPLLHTNQR